MIDVDEDGILNLMEAQHVLRCLGFKGFDAESVNKIIKGSLRIHLLLRLKDWLEKSVLTKHIFLCLLMSTSLWSQSTGGRSQRKQTL